MNPYNSASVTVDVAGPVEHFIEHAHGRVSFWLGERGQAVSVLLAGTHADLLDFADRLKAAVLADLDRVTAPVVVEVDRRRPEAPTLPVAS